MLDDCTIVIKSFLRPHCLARLLVTVHRYYSNVPTIVVDDSGDDNAQYICRPYEYVTLIQTPERDIGCSRGRNIGVANVKTEYFVTLDDDFILCAATDFIAMKRRLQEVNADIVCGTCIEPAEGVIRQSAMEFVEHSGQSLLVRGSLTPGQEGWVKASNCFFIARTDIRRKVLWPEAVKTSEHAPFFWLAHLAGCKVWASTVSSVVHFRDVDPLYDHFRQRIVDRTDVAAVSACDAFSQHHGFRWLTDELIREFGSQVGAHNFGWPRFIPPNNVTQRKLCEFLHKEEGIRDMPRRNS